MKLQDLLSGRDKLRKYDRINGWRNFFNEVHAISGTNKDGRLLGLTTEIPDNIKQIIISALDAEIAKLDEE